MSRKTGRNIGPKQITRREFLRGLAVGGAVLGSTAFLNSCGLLKKTTAPITYTPANATINPSLIPKTTSPLSTAVGVNLLLLNLTLGASNSAAMPVDADTGYPIKDRIFIDWNAGSQTRWFQWNLPAAKAAKALWQVSMMPYDNSNKTIMNPPGLVSSGVVPGTQTEFSINTSKFTPAVSAVKKNFGGPAFYTTAQQNVSNSSVSRVRTILPPATGLASINSAISSQISSAASRYSSIKSAVSGYSASLSPISTAKPVFPSQAVIVSDATMAATKAVLEATTTASMHLYYVRVVVLDASDKPIGAPSNAIQVMYGNPIFEKDITVLDDMMLAQVYTTGDFQYQAAIMLDWNGNAASLTKKYVAPLADTADYAYSYFQVTQIEVRADRDYALYPDGLVTTVLTQQTETGVDNQPWATTKIDFSKFVSPADPKNPAVTRYYVRAVHVYADPGHIGYARLAFSPPMAVNYGDLRAVAIPDSAIIPINIGTPSIRFVSYTAPFFGDNPSDHAIVTKTPMITWTAGASTMVVGTPFSSLKPGDKVRISDLEAWLEDQKRNEGSDILTSIIHAFETLIGGIADLVNSIADEWTQIQGYAVGALASLGLPPAIGGLLINAALMAAGIPPTLPNFEDLTKMGTGAIADMIVEQSGGVIPKDLADAATQQLFQQAEKAASTTIGGLPDDLSMLNGCLKPDMDFVWKAAMISVELYNPLTTQIPSGSFVVRLVESGDYKVLPSTKDFFKPQTINYPPMKGGQKVNLTIPLEENCFFTVGNGTKGFVQDYGGGVEDSTWNKLIAGHKQLEAVIEQKQPNIPNPTDYLAELGTHGLLLHFNIIDPVLNIKQDMSNIKTSWQAANDRFPSAIYVSPSGNDSANGSIYHPLKTLDHALAIAGSNDSVVMAPGTYTATNANITKPYVTLVGAAPGAIIKGAAGADFAIKATQAATEFSMRGLEVDGAVYINGPDGVVLDGVRVNNPKSLGIQIVNCSEPWITNCEVGRSGTTAPALSNGIVMDGCYAFVVDNCYVHDIAGNGVQILNTAHITALSVIKNCTISNCNTGILMSGSANRAENCFIHDTNLAGVDFVNSSNCSFSRCTLLNTALDRDYSYAPIYFDTGSTPNSVTMDDTDNYGPTPHTFYAENNIFSEGTDNNIIMLVNASDDLSKLGITKTQNAYVNNNIYYSKMGLVKYIDLRTGKRYQFTRTATMPSGINSFEWVSASEDRDSKELDPKVDSQGRSVVADCLGKGIQ
jgi:hypothetical protein